MGHGVTFPTKKRGERGEEQSPKRGGGEA